MSEKRAVYVGPSQTGVDLRITFDDGDVRDVHVDHGHELLGEYEGRKVPAAFRDGLLAQADNWSERKRATGADTQGTKDGGE